MQNRVYEQDEETGLTGKGRKDRYTDMRIR